jgi:hypothetical protein
MFHNVKRSSKLLEEDRDTCKKKGRVVVLFLIDSIGTIIVAAEDMLIPFHVCMH